MQVHPGLFVAGHDQEVWTYLTAFPDAYQTPEHFPRWMQKALAETAAGREGVWVIIDRGERCPDRQLALSGVQPRYGQKPPSVDRGVSFCCSDEVLALVVRAAVEAEYRQAVST